MKKELKRSLSLLLAITIIFSSAYIGFNEIDFSVLFEVKAKAASVSDLTFTLNEDGKSYSVSDCNTSATGKMVIPSTYNGLPIDTIGNYAFSGCTSLTSVTIPDSITNIGSEAFFNCTNLEAVYITDVAKWCSINFYDNYSNPLIYANNLYINGNLVTDLVIPSSVTSINWCAFEYCTSLKSVTIENGVKSINGFAFSDCTSLTSVNIPNSVTSIAGYAFQNCKNLTSITIPNSVTSIGDRAFYDCLNLNSVTIPDTLTNLGEFIIYNTAYYKNSSNWVDGLLYIGSNLIEAEISISGDVRIKNGTKTIASKAFYKCSNLVSVTIPDTVVNLGEYTFNSCPNLTSVKIGNSVTSVGNQTFYGCTSLTSIIIPDSVESIGICAFSDCTNLKSVSFGDGVTNIGKSAFDGCTNLISVIIPDSVTSIGSYAFYDCANLASATIGNGVTNIGNHAFYRCTKLTSIIIPDSVENIGTYAFFRCSNLESITIGSGIKYIGEYAFFDCTSLNSVHIKDIVRWCGIDFDSNPLKYAGNLYINDKLITTLVIPESVTSISESAFSGWTGLTSITIPNSVTSIGKSAFSGCIGLTSITIPNSVTTIGSHAFYGCTGLKSFEIPDSVTSNIDVQTFYGCTGLESVKIGNGITSIGSLAFSGCTNLTSITISDSVTTIGDKAFYGNTKLTSVTLPKNVTSIGFETFYDCTSLTSISIPDSVTKIGNRAFYNTAIYNNESNWINDVLYICNHLIKAKTSITGSYSLIEGTKKIADYAFYECKNVESITIPDSVTSIGGSVFEYCTNLTRITIPNGVKSISNNAFYGCNELKYVFYSGSESEWANITIGDYNTPLTNAVIHYNSTDHSYDNWVIDAEPTCTTAGQKHHVCSVCSYTETSEMEYGHKYSNWIITLQPTCTEKGSRSKTCSKCGDVFTEEILETGHQNTMWVTEQEPNCSAPGYKDEYCLDCGEKIGTEEIPVTSHLNTTWVIEQEPTCDVAGYKDEYCLDCGEKVGAEEIPAKGHSYSTTWTIDIKATCTAEGSKSHHCTTCGDKGDITVIAPLGHDYIIISADAEHPHTTLYKCSRCTDTKEETATLSNCALCNFSYTDIDSATCRITGYIGGKSTFAIPATINGKTVTTTTTGAFKNNTTLTFVKIENGVQGLGSLAFLGCKALSKVVIPESVTTIGANAFYNCASDFTIYCFRDSYAMQYAIDNSLNYVVMDIGETDNCTIDYDNELIYVSVDSLTSIDDILYVPTDSMVFAEASLISGANEFLGTGSTVTVFDGNDISSEYTLIVEGDTNGDSVCDALDAAQIALVANGHQTIDGVYKMAADNNSDDVVDVEDYQAIVNKVVS